MVSKLTDSKQNKKVFCLIITGLFFFANLYLVFCHESWRDEAQAWLIARDLSISGIFYQMRFEGHPCLWHLLLVPLTRLGLPYATMKILSLIIVTASVFVLLRYSSFHPAVRVILVFSAAYMYFMPCISRSYCLIPLLMAVAAIIFNTKTKKPVVFGAILFLLVQTHVYLLGFCFAVCLVWLWDVFFEFRADKDIRKLFGNGLGLLLPLLSALLFYIQVATSLESSSSANPNLTSNPLYSLWSTSVTSFSTLFGGLNSKAATIVFICYIFTLVLVFLPLLLSKSKCEHSKAVKSIFILVLGVLFQVAFFAFFYNGSGMLQKALIIFYIILFSIWIICASIENKAFVRNANLLIAAFAIAISIGNYPMVAKDVVYQYSASETAANLIRETVPPEEPIFSCNYPIDSAIIPYLPEYKFYTAGSFEEFTYVTWSDSFLGTRDYQDFLYQLWYQYPDKEGFYVLTSSDNVTNADGTAATLIFETREDGFKTTIDEAIYKLYYVRVK
ncbi:MAG: hypothetical protein GX683_00685 [Ruminococcaceae bacterium]|nr:hypothetical protein [Oscillospiraceae bacterium]